MISQRFVKVPALLLIFILGSICANNCVDAKVPSKESEGTHTTSKPMQPPSPQPALILARRWLPSDIFRLLLPITFSITNPLPNSAESTALTISDIQFLGVTDDWSKATAIVVAVPGTQINTNLNNSLLSTDKDTDLQAIGSRLIQNSASPDWLVVMSVTVRWRPWRLELNARKAEVVTRAGAASAAPAYLKGTLTTADQLPKLFDLDLSQVQAPLDSAHVLRLNVAMSFGANTITFGLIPSEVADSWKAPGPGMAGLSIDSSGASPDTSVVFSIPHSFINGILTTLYQGSSIPLGGGLVVSSLSATTFNDPALCPNTCFTIIGDLNNGNQPAVRVAIDWSGEDLKFLNARIVKNLCPLNAACQLLEFKARVGSLKIKNDFTKPTPHLLRPEGVRQLGSFTIAGKQITLNLLTRNLQVRPEGLFSSGFATLISK